MLGRIVFAFLVLSTAGALWASAAGYGFKTAVKRKPGSVRVGSARSGGRYHSWK